MFNVRLLRPALALGALLGLAGCYSNPGAVGPMPYPVASPVLGADGSSVVGYVGTTCGAGFYICQVPAATVGSQCACPGLGAPSYGTVR